MSVQASSSSADHAALLRLERARLLELLRGLGPGDWARPTPCPAWDVAGLCRHLLGDDLFVLSSLRDDHLGTPPPAGLDELGFIAWLDRLQLEWVDAARRISPRLVVELLTSLGPPVADAVDRLDPRLVTGRVSWASDGPVPMWLEAARTVSEYWIHRQQLLAALGRPADLRGDLLEPILDALRWAWPRRLAAVDAAPGATIGVEVSGSVERRWWIVRDDAWTFAEAPGGEVVATARLTTDQSWRLLSNNLDRDTVLDVTGAPDVVDVLLRTRAIIGSPA